MKTVDVLKEARAKIEIGWCRNRMEQKRGDRMCYCAIGAINATDARCRESERAIAELAKTVCPDREATSSWAIVAFNDSSTSKRRVLNAFDKTIARLGG